jgi:Protein of unknown function (DUF2892)
MTNRTKEIRMEHNVGGVDRSVRIVVGLALLSLVVLLEGNARWWGLIGVPLVLTGLLRWCPAYLPFGIKTCKAGQ